jgi:hypothetical protein
MTIDLQPGDLIELRDGSSATVRSNPFHNAAWFGSALWQVIVEWTDEDGTYAMPCDCSAIRRVWRNDCLLYGDGVPVQMELFEDVSTPISCLLFPVRGFII